MKKIILSAFFVLLIMNLNAQKSTGTIKVTDELTIKVKKLLDDYVSNDFNSWESFHSDEMICYFNNSLIDKKNHDRWNQARSFKVQWNSSFNG
jgi:hypothetical protein